jgi:hypothetical protein
MDSNLDRARGEMKLLAGIRVVGYWDTRINLARFQGAPVYLGAVTTGRNDSHGDKPVVRPNFWGHVRREKSDLNRNWHDASAG